MPHSPRIVVVGSINMDLVARVGRLPRPGETVQGTTFAQVPGGKGANQAVAAARLGADVKMIGRVGDDAFGEQLVESLRQSGVRTELVQTTANGPSGLALIGVEDSGQNAITVIGGANQLLKPADVQAHTAAVAAADALLVQLEVPIETVAAAVSLARQHGVVAILDPAPVPAFELPRELLAVDVLSPNQAEAEALTGMSVATLADAVLASQQLHRRGASRVVIKLGELGALASESDSESGSRPIHIPAPQVRVVDTTAAGDAFTAALAVALVEGQSLAEATRFACAAGSLATTRRGAQSAMPLLAEVAELMRKGVGSQLR